MIDLSRALFLVDGLSDLRSLKRRFIAEFKIEPGFRVVHCNGKSVSAEAYACKAFPLISQAYSDVYDQFVVVADRETRRCSASAFARALREALLEVMVPARINAPLHTCVADRMFENWIVADVDGIKNSELIRQDAVQAYYDGQSGKAVLKKMMRRTYQNTLHAPVLFQRVRFESACENSPSFSDLCQKLELFDTTTVERTQRG